MTVENSLLDVALGAALRLTRVQSPVGYYLYQFDTAKDVASNKSYNMVRMCGTAYSMTWAAQVFCDHEAGKRLAASAELAIDFLIRICKLSSPAFYVGEFSPDDGVSRIGKLGSSALLLNALLFEPFSRKYEKEARALKDTLLGAQLPSSGFSGRLDSPEEKKGSQRYFPGEALLALTRYSIAFKDHATLERVIDSLAFYETYFSVDPHAGMVLWHTDCWTRVARVCQASGDEEIAKRCMFFCKALIRSIEPVMERWKVGIISSSTGRPTASIGSSDAVFIEALSRYVEHADLLGAGQQEELKYTALLSEILPCLRALQYGVAEALQFKRPDLVRGACRTSSRSSMLRMDNDQHLITACLTLLEKPVM